MHNQKTTSIARIPLLDLSQGTEMLSEFTAEALNLLIDAENSVHTLEKFNQEPAAIANLFKIFHTIKGLAGFLNLEDMRLLSSEAEKMLDMIRKEKMEFSDSVIPLTSNIITALRRLLLLLKEQIENHGQLKSPYWDIGPLVDQIRDTLSGFLAETDDPTLLGARPTGPRNHHELKKEVPAGRPADDSHVQNLMVKLDEAIRLKEEAQRTAKIKSEYLTSMSHEIRTLMNSIVGFANILQNSALSDKQRAQLNNIISSGKLLLEIVNDILDLSKSETGKLKFEMIDFDLRVLLEQVITITSPRVQNKPVRLLSEIDERIAFNLIGDPTRLRQILINLIDNAIKFTDQGQVDVFVRLEKESDLTIGRQQTLQFAVKDTGLGIPKDKQSTIFESFKQVDSSTTRLYGGSGLGLSICKNYVLGMGGKIWVESQPDKGSQFIFVLTFPVGKTIRPGPKDTVGEKAVAGKLPRAELEQISCAGVRVLVVDDSLPNLELMQAYFETLGCWGDYVSDGPQAIEKIKKNQYDICFMDLLMPQMNGLETVRIIRREAGRDVPIIALTAADADEEKKECLQAGMNDYVLKPFDVLDLKEKIIEHVQRK